MGSLTANLKQSSLTLYEQLANKILNDINHEKYLPGAQIPTELELQRSTGYSRSTVRHALRILVNKGVLVKIHGKVPSFRMVPVMKQHAANSSV
ncbi:GntR family transcriptional regulator [Lacticaseibacillus pantheris]|uniref:GntR family transcriptional regulator n=1 Tax=Lacticaseibacillus pantheris TaxID=171523 RepID=UPI0006D0353A|nr:GntR family transcriptional regulator [Lacticaseibacillus pantheris]